MSSSRLPDIPARLARLARTDPARFAREIDRMDTREQVRVVLEMAPGERAHALTHVGRPMRVVRAVPAPDLYLTLREIGPVDALPLLELASRAQLQHLVDLESWRHDRFDGLRAGSWAAVLAEAGEPTLRRYVRSAEDAELALLFLRWARVEQIEFDDQVPVHGHGQTEAGDERGIMAPDGYHRFRPEIAEHGPAVHRLASMLFREDPSRYQRLIWAALSEMPAQLEEDALRWRQSRLEEHGYPSFDEAIEIYAPASGGPVPPPTLEATTDETPSAPYYPLTTLGRGSRLARALERVDDAMAESVGRQIVALASRVIVADGLDTGRPETHHRAVRKVAGMIEIGLAERSDPVGRDTVELLRTVALRELFRSGHSRIVRLRERARVLVRDGWASIDENALDLLDPPIRPRIEGLLMDRPAYFDLGATGDRPDYRDFLEPREIDETRGALEIAETVGRLFVSDLHLDVSRLVADARARSRDTPRFSTLLLTMMAWSAARDELRLEPLPDAVVADFLRDVASRRTAPPDASARALDGLVRRLVDVAGVRSRDVGVLAAFGRACLERLSEECATLDPGIPIDGRHVSCLWLASRPTPEVPR